MLRVRVYALPGRQVGQNRSVFAPLHRMRRTFYQRNAVKILLCCLLEFIRRERLSTDKTSMMAVLGCPQRPVPLFFPFMLA